MIRRKVQNVTPISATASSRPVTTSQTNSILSDPDSRWVASRQGAINDAFAKRVRAEIDENGELKSVAPHGLSNSADWENSLKKLSGENDRIGRSVRDDDTPFGEYVGFF
ncbi:hypothetical protein [Brucella intermedia]|uniref:hypothetical protein n=1 Tax=Brucella intermedia TaxID=94625 RepID=UPI00124C7D0F|nr:hypothetical protein [Brucella intermedia]KAB2704391.1 hypothetical protein F9K80_22815 [Brucella intermedia]